MVMLVLVVANVEVALAAVVLDSLLLAWFIPTVAHIF